jgi:hypothetical protein
VVLIGILLFSLLPILLSLVDAFIGRGGTIKVAGVEINFAQVKQLGTPEFSVPANIGVPGEPVNDSSTSEILDSLKQATANEVVIIDLEEGQAWWETRLLVLLVGAVRLKKPEKVVFLGRDAKVDKYFQGWGYASELLSCLMLAHPQYLRSYYAAQAAARQWELVEPVNPVDPNYPTQNPGQPPSIQPGLATQHPWMAFDNTTGLPNPLLAEQLLASDLGEKVEQKEGAKRISLVRLEELFRPVLHKESIDQTLPAECQINEFFNGDAAYIALTQNGKYTTLVSRLTVLNSIVRTLIEKE